MTWSRESERSQERPARIGALVDTWADTTTPHGRLMLTVLGERELIRARTGEGRERAKARGVKMGPKLNLPRTSSARPSSAATRRASRCAIT
jgi:DNA invertase Pin-like site-specific DNA recombinase